MGPASYNPSASMTNFHNSPQYSMGARFRHGSSLSLKNFEVPDPTRYSPNVESMKKRSPQIKIGRGVRQSCIDEKKVNSTPAPNKYVIKSQTWDKEPHFYMGRRTLNNDFLAKSTTMIPGPGQYS